MIWRTPGEGLDLFLNRTFLPIQIPANYQAKNECFKNIG